MGEWESVSGGGGGGHFILEVKVQLGGIFYSMQSDIYPT